MNYFTHYWKNETWEKNRNSNFPGTLLEHLSGNDFHKCNIKIGDVGYVVTIKEGLLYLCGKLIVGKYCGINEAARITGLKPEQLWQADEHIIASEATAMLWDLRVPLVITKQLEFFDGSKTKRLTFESKDRLDRQTLRVIRKLTPHSAALLDTLLGDIEPVETFSEKEIALWKDESATDETDADEFESYVEGNKKKKYVTYYERIPKNREQAIKIHGYICKGCKFNFEKTYGSHGKDFIHVHHIKPVSQFEKPQKVNPETDLTVVCPNCHAMIHRYKDKTLSMKELKNLIQTNR